MAFNGAEPVSPPTLRRFADLTALTAAQAVEDAVGALTPIDPVLG